MSLINDALRKAQKQRTGESVPLGALPSVGGESAARIHRRGKPAGFYTLVLRLGLGAAGLAVLVIGGYFVLRTKSDDSGQKAVHRPAIASAQLPAPSTPLASPQPGGGGSSSPAAKRPDEPALASATAGAPTTTFTLPIAAASQVSGPRSQVSDPAVAQQTAGQTPGGQQPATAQPASAKGEGLSPQVSAPLAKMAGKAIDYIENLRIAGIRASTTDAKVLMNDRVYRINDLVERELGLKLVGITSSSLTFEDEHGAKYTRNF